MSTQNNLASPTMDGPSEFRLAFKPVVRLAATAYSQHTPIDGTCPVCGTATCEPYADADVILAAAAGVPYIAVSNQIAAGVGPDQSVA